MSPSATFKRRSPRSLSSHSRIFRTVLWTLNNIFLETKCTLYGTPDHFPFLLLPAEVRNLIYGQLFTKAEPLEFEEDISMSSNKGYRLEGVSPKFPISLLCTSRRIHDEATSILYGDNQFSFHISCRPPQVCAWTGPVCIDTFSASIAPRNVRKIRQCTFKLYRWGWGKESNWMKNRIRNMANEFGGEHQLQCMRVDFKTSLLSKRIRCRPRFYRPFHPNEVTGLDRIAFERDQVQMLDPLKRICGVGCVNVTGVTRDYAIGLKTAMEADEPLVVKSKSKAKGRAKKRKRQSNYYKYHKD